ncbi:protein FAM110A-like [Genypterus blacodes]|uniref:protein FAM110A-like n=1 Tax=Genypterus blacodes TaxID=154954 RepID=UPI003F76C1C1
MPVGTVPHSLRQPVRTAVAVTPPRLRPKGPVGPDFHRQSPTAAERPKQSAVERLEADKAKYVKSQVALSKQQPVRPAEVRRPLLNPASALRPTRRPLIQTKTQPSSVPLDLKHLSNLISGVNDGPLSEQSRHLDCATTRTHSSPYASHKEDRPCPPPRHDWSTPAKVRLKAFGPAKVENPGSPVSSAAMAVRRVDVIPQASSPVRTPCRPPQFIRQPLQPIALHSQFPLHLPLRLFHPRTTPASSPSPVKPVLALSKPDKPPSSQVEATVPAQPPPSLPVFPPPSPSFTRLSSSSSRKRPSLTRSKSDMSDRYSRAGTELERFFNLCGLDPTDIREFPGSTSDIVSLARFRSVSAPGSECAGSDRENEDDDDEEEDAANVAERVPYGVSVIERNARVIKWLYGLRQSKDNVSKTTNL